MEEPDYIRAHKHSAFHRAELEASEICGCFYCLKICKPNEIGEWWDGGQTAVCPFCGIDSVVGSVSGFPINQDFLKKMRAHWFE